MELTQRISNLYKNVGMLYPLIKEKLVPQKVKVLLYTTILRPILPYESECWSLNTKHKSRVEAAEMRVLRLIKGVTKRERLRSDNIRKELGVLPILTFIERNQLRWYGHIRRMEHNRYPIIFFNWTPHGRRPAGRPRKRWRDAVSDAARKRGKTLEDLEEDQLFLDRSAWKAFVKLVT